ncbi:V-type ATP synthase subunit I, partial [Finegoldia magna]|uniref:V-type ATP synthase subunit I n=1 Tax=Finegoldia magna TaxID=1260 RepID=UPI0028FF390C
DDSRLTPPTKLKNNKFFKPFELLVNMYGTPSYKEIDPTVFFGLTYMLLFGAMFGDLGQGAVMFVAGVLLAKFKDKMMGGLLERIGASSMIFGILYGSFFGLEGIIPALFLKPFENINKVLIIAIGLGIVLLLIAYILGLCNNYIFKDVQEGLFGQEGLAGFMLFLLFLLLAATVALELHVVPVGVIAACMLIVIFVMIFKVPLTQLLYKRRPLHNGLDVTGYYVESSFSIIETLISMFSSTVSFIRVGAFAINHVGLFLAFTSIGKMIGTNAGNVAMIIVGNIVILGLEGLIVFIQSLRLEYYELFSKYFKGDGILFQPTIKRI